MPAIHSEFSPPFYLRNGHVQTILGALMPLHRSQAPLYRRERLELEDGDFLDLDWAEKSRERLAILSHGLEGSSRNTDVRRLASTLNLHGWDVLAWNFRSCSGEENRLLRFYHSGETGDLASVISHASDRYDRIALVGFSLGGNMTLKYLGEAPSHPKVLAAVAVSAPIDLAASSKKLDRRPGNGIYMRRFMKRLRAKVESKALRFPGELDTRNLQRVMTFAEFDNRYTAKLHGFQNAEDYWTQASSLQYLPGIQIPTLLLNALDDPFLATECFPGSLAVQSKWVYLEAPKFGGHLGFLDSKGCWLNRRIPEFLAATVS